MRKLLAEAVETSTAQGINRAVGSRAKPLRIMWALLFVLFLATFLKGGISLVQKLMGNKLTKEYHLDAVQFQFPDLYFCPNNAYSGSYPFMLTQSEARTVNSEVARAIGLYEKLFDMGLGQKYEDAFQRVMSAQTSLPFHLFVRHMILRKEQSILKSELVSNFQGYSVQLEAFHHPENLVCFKPVLTDDLRQKMTSANSVFNIWLSTDPHFTDFNFTGHPIDPIVDGTNQSIQFLDWHPTLVVEKLKMNGFTMLIVPPGVYPSLSYEKKFYLAPGNAYSVKLQMEEDACSEELYQTHCVDNSPLVPFMDPLTGHHAFFNYSSAACHYRRLNARLTELGGCQWSSKPLLWEFRHWPRCSNVSEMTEETVAKAGNITYHEFLGFETDAAQYCRTRIPCKHQKYSASFSFGKWPGGGSSVDHYFATSVSANETAVPALARLVAMAKEIQSGANHSVHTETIFRSYVADSMISASISVASVMSPQVMLTWAYSFSDLLADTGGLLGLYIGCSVLTFCELVELVYVIGEYAFGWRRSQSAGGAHVASSATGDLQRDTGRGEASGDSNFM